MKGVNKVILIGTLSRDPETKTFPNGGSVTNFSMATSESWNDKTTGERKEVTEWHSIVANGKLGEICQKHLKKGSKVYIEGAIRTRQYQDQNGNDKYITEIRANELQMLDSRPQQQQQAQTQTYAKPAAQPKPVYSGNQPKQFDDDLPF